MTNQEEIKRKEVLKNKAFMALMKKTWTFLSNLKCTICHEILIVATVTNCGHSFCKLCISKWKNEQSKLLENGKQKLAKCPMCNTEIKTLAPNHILKDHVEEMCNLLLTKKEKSARQKTIQEHIEEIRNLHWIPKDSLNLVHIPILTIDGDDSDDIVIENPEQGSHTQNNEGGAQIRELQLFLDDSDPDSTTFERIGDIVVHRRLDHQHYQEERELVHSNGRGSITDMPHPHESTTDMPSPDSTGQSGNRRHHTSRSAGRMRVSSHHHHSHGHSSTRSMPRPHHGSIRDVPRPYESTRVMPNPDSTGQSENRRHYSRQNAHRVRVSSHHVSNGHSSTRSMPRPHHGYTMDLPRPSSYRIEDRRRNHR